MADRSSTRRVTLTARDRMLIVRALRRQANDVSRAIKRDVELDRNHGYWLPKRRAELSDLRRLAAQLDED